MTFLNPVLRTSAALATPRTKPASSISSRRIPVISQRASTCNSQEPRAARRAWPSRRSCSGTATQQPSCYCETGESTTYFPPQFIELLVVRTFAIAVNIPLSTFAPSSRFWTSSLRISTTATSKQKPRRWVIFAARPASAGGFYLPNATQERFATRRLADISLTSSRCSLFLNLLLPL